MRSRFAAFAFGLLCLASHGCSNKTSADEEANMRKAVQGKGVGPMPDDIRQKMEAAMKQHGVGGAPPPAASAGTTPNGPR